jgi:hypothetical protein
MAAAVVFNRDRILGLAWVVVGLAELGLALYSIYRVWTLTAGSSWLSYWGYGVEVLYSIIPIVIGIGLWFRQKWAWIMALIVSLLLIFSAVLGLASLFGSVGSGHFLDMAKLVLPRIIIMALLSIFTMIRFFQPVKPWRQS